MAEFNAVVAIQSYSGKYDLRDAECKALCDSLTSETWVSLVRRDVKYDLEELIEAIHKTAHFPHISSRLKDIYFLTAFHKFSCEIGMLRDWMKQEKHYSGFLFCKSKMIYDAILDMGAGERSTGALKILKATQEYFSGNITTPFLSYCRSVVAVTDQRGWAAGAAIESSLSKGAILVSADLLYARRFLKRYIGSLASRLDVNDVDFVLCLIADEEEFSLEDRAFLMEIGENYNKGRFILDLKNKPDYGDIRTYYACARFMFAADYLRGYDYLLVTDMDYEIREGASFSGFVNICKDYSLGVNKKELGLGSFFPWLKYTAGTVYVRNDGLGLEFLMRVSELFDHNYNANLFNWGLDQNILYSLFESLAEHGLADRYLNIKNIKEPFTVPYDIK